MIDLRHRVVIERLLGRDVRQILTADDRLALSGARVLITGAGGSVGSELARQIAACGPQSLTLVDHSEYALFRIEQELCDAGADALDPRLADITRPGELARICERCGPDVVFHAAAYKHVTMLERDAIAALRTNVLGTLEVARAARDGGARCVLISSDKAANPTSVMGASKRLAEIAVLAVATSDFTPVVVRFGNILGSSGSLVEILVDRIRRGLPLRITHGGATRYFMSGTEAAELVIKADLLGRGGEIMWLDMGEPVKILDLVERLLVLGEEAGYPRVPIEFVGLRPGEKLEEELSTEQGLRLTRTAHPRIWSARQALFDVRRVQRGLLELEEAVEQDAPSEALAALRRAVPEYMPSQAARRIARDRSTQIVRSHPRANRS